MDEESAEAYLKRKGKAVTPENVKRVQTEGKIYGDPVAEISW